MSSEVKGGASTSATPKKEQMDAQRKATELLAQGKRNHICQELPAAVQQFQEACQILSGEFGELAKECAEAYFHYGSALLDLSRMEQGVLGNALEGVDVDADDEEGPDNEQFEKTDKVDGTPKDKEMKEPEEAEEEEEEEGDEEEEAEEGEEEAAGSQDENQENADDIPNLQLAWEMFELAKLIYSKDPCKTSQLKAAEAYLKLGEVSLEGEQYDKAIQDLEMCVSIQKEHLDPCDRAIAETYYQLGLACQLTKQFDKAKEYFTSAVTSLEGKIDNLKAIIESKPVEGESGELGPVETAQNEINEIQDILPEIRAKIQDTEEEEKSMESLKAMTKQAMGAIFAAADSTSETGFAGTSSAACESKAESSDAPKTMDISHLVRKKRKPEEGEPEKMEEDLENKKPKQEGGSGDAVVNGVEEKESSSGTSEAVAAR